MREKELRLALVCYGGISLAVYMHGITKEIWHIARASRGLHDGEAAGGGGTAGVYRDVLAAIEEASDERVRVLPDIIAGASAGGINGIFLAQALATGQSLEPLTQLWLDIADVETLIDPGAAPPSRFSKLWALPIAWMAAGRSAGEVERTDAATREEVRAKMSHFVRSRWFEPPFSGPGFCDLLLDALEAMAATERGPRLLPDGQPLDLFVTVTDFAGHPERLRLHSPREVVETEHRVVIDFSDHGERVDALASPAELAFAGRATSSFPGAFPPFSVGELDAVIARRGIAWPGRRAFLHRVLPRQAAAGSADKAVLIDGSVLANAPFRPALEALRERPARRQVDRRFIYIDPFPGFRFGFDRAGAQPGFFQTILGAVSELPRKQPIRDNLETIAERSERIARLRGVLEATRPAVEAEIDALFGRMLFLDKPTAQRLAGWRRRAHQGAAAKAGYGYAAYTELKLASVVDALATLLYQVGGRSAPELWRRLRDAIDPAMRAADPADFLRDFDLGFRIRRLRLLAHRLAEVESENDSPETQRVREAIYDSLAPYLDLQRTDAHRLLRPLVRAAEIDIGAILAALRDGLRLAAYDAETDERLVDALAGLSRPERRTLLLSYLGYAYFDTATLPLLQGEGLDEFDPIKVDRIAPDDATSIRAGGAEATLKGIQFNNFGAFFSRAYRENDYLWGRLHGAERMIDILVSTIEPGARLKAGRLTALKRAAFLAILDEEEARLPEVGALIAELRRDIG